MGTAENNKLIAEFMGLKLHPDFEMCQHPIRKDKSFENIAFHYNWNWLMEVVEKIESLNFTVDIQNVIGLGQYCRIFSAGADVVTVRDYKTKVKAVYNACVEFVQWYNQQNTKL